MKKLTIALVFLLAGCVGVPDGVTPVEDFDLERYLGRWYEIARLDHPFERGLDRVTADYSLRADGWVAVRNRGCATTENRWKEAEGKATFAGARDQGHLKVSFFGPFYGSYVVFGLDREHYRYSLVCGPDKSYLWILARDPQLGADVKAALLQKAAAAGFETDRLIYVDHGASACN